MNKTKMTEDDILNRFAESHDTGQYQYYPFPDKFTVKTKIEIRCKEHGIFTQTIEHHMNGQGCPKCQLLRLHQSRTLSRGVWIDRFEKVHGRGKYDYSKLPQNPKSEEPFPIYCAEHDVTFHQTPNLHWHRKQGCPRCGIAKGIETRKDNQIMRSVFIEKAHRKNGLGYAYINMPKEFSLDATIGIFCVTHNKLFFCKGSEHLEGRGCPDCSKG